VASAHRRCGWPGVVSTGDKVEVAKVAGASDVVLADGFKVAVKE
jgi:NADPH2:quinone reductase